MTIAMVAGVGSALAIAAAASQLDGAELPGRSAGRRRVGHRSGAQAGAVARSSGAPPRPAWQRLAMAAVLGGCVGFLVGGPLGAAALGTTAVGGLAWHVRRRADQQRRARERAAPALARSLSDALRGGASVRGALAAAADDRSIPAELRRALTEAARAVQLGAPIDASLRTLSACGGPGLRLLCGTVVLHLEAGGPLARELRQVAADGEVALRVDEDRVAATAQARATVRVVAALPILALFGAEVASPDFLPRIASKPLPLAMLLLGFALETTAIVAARAIVGGQR